MQQAGARQGGRDAGNRGLMKSRWGGWLKGDACTYCRLPQSSSGCARLRLFQLPSLKKPVFT